MLRGFCSPCPSLFLGGKKHLCFRRSSRPRDWTHLSCTGTICSSLKAQSRQSQRQRAATGLWSIQGGWVQGLRGGPMAQLASLPGCAFLQTGLIHELPVMKYTCQSSKHLLGPLGTKSTRKEKVSFSLKCEPQSRSWFSKNPRVKSTPEQSQCLGRLGFPDPLDFDAPVPIRNQGEVSPAPGKGTENRQGRSPKEIPPQLPRQREWTLCGYKTTCVHSNHVGFIIGDHSWLSRWRNLGKRKVRHPTPRLLWESSCLGSQRCMHRPLQPFDSIQHTFIQHVYTPGTV